MSYDIDVNSGKYILAFNIKYICEKKKEITQMLNSK